MGRICQLIKHMFIEVSKSGAKYTRATDVQTYKFAFWIVIKTDFLFSLIYCNKNVILFYISTVIPSLIALFFCPGLNKWCSSNSMILYTFKYLGAEHDSENITCWIRILCDTYGIFRPSFTVYFVISCIIQMYYSQLQKGI